MIAFICPGCRKSLQVKDEFGGNKAKCPQCGTVFLVPTSALTAHYDRGTESVEAGRAQDRVRGTRSVWSSSSVARYERKRRR